MRRSCGLGLFTLGPGSLRGMAPHRLPIQVPIKIVPLLKLLLTFRHSAAIHEATAPNLNLRVKSLSARSFSVVIMANDEMLTDDYVAELLAKDAKESTIKYSSLGLEAFAQSK
jgi:hypothetical protein